MPFEPPNLISLPSEIAEVRFLDRSHQSLRQEFSLANRKIEYIAHKLHPIPSMPGSEDRNRRTYPPKLVKTLTEHGFGCHPVKSLPLPAPGWWMYLPNLMGNGYAFEFNPKNDSETAIRVSSTGNAGTLEEANAQEKAFRKTVYNEPPHKLTRPELDAIEGELSSEFSSAQTYELNGKRVLELCGHFKEGDRDVYRLNFNYLDDSIDKFAIAELEFQAKPDKFRKYIKAVKHCFSQIQWSTKSENPTK